PADEARLLLELLGLLFQNRRMRRIVLDDISSLPAAVEAIPARFRRYYSVGVASEECCGLSFEPAAALFSLTDSSVVRFRRRVRRLGLVQRPSFSRRALHHRPSVGHDGSPHLLLLSLLLLPLNLALNLAHRSLSPFLVSLVSSFSISPQVPSPSEPRKS